ncbi:MAG: vWA domain-containing protein [Candidatus Binatia bacterium]
MIWRDPLYFTLLAAVLVLGGALVVLLRRRAALLRQFAEAALVARLTPDVDGRYLTRRTIVRLAALSLIVVALAGPKWGFHWQEVRREGIDLIVALDTSRSMLATDVKPNRLERAKFAIMDLLPLLQGDRVGLVPFAGTAFLECPLTLDAAAFERSLRAVDVGIIPRGGTSLARAIDTSLEAFEARQGKYEALILITDGEDHEGDVKEAAARAAERGVKIFTVGIGTSEGELLPVGQSFVKDRSGQVVKSRLAEDPLKEIAEASGGAYVRGLGPSLGLDEVFRDHIATMERREVASALERRYEERFQIPLGLAFLLLLLEQLMPRRRAAAPVGLAAAKGTRSAAALLLCLLPMLVGFLDPPGDLGAEGNALYDEGQFDAAAGKYGEALVDMPASPLLQFNLAAAQYKQGKLDDAIVSLTKVAATGDPEWVARATFNLGNAQYRVGAAAEPSDPQAAIQAYEEALASYKRSMVADQTDPDPKFNHEFVTRKLADLKKRLEEEKQKQEQEEQEKQEQQEPPPQDEQQKDQEQSDEQQQQEQPPPDEQQQGGEEQPDQQPQEDAQQPPPEDQPQEGEQQQPQPQPEVAQEPSEPQGGSAAAAGEGEPSDPDQQAAQAVLDTARGEELGPEDLKRPAVAGVGEPSQDW